jgi:hypothetical protein
LSLSYVWSTIPCFVRLFISFFILSSLLNIFVAAKWGGTYCASALDLKMDSPHSYSLQRLVDSVLSPGKVTILPRIACDMYGITLLVLCAL